MSVRHREPDDDPPPRNWPQLCGDLRMAVYGMTPAYRGLLMRGPMPTPANQLVRSRPTSEVSAPAREPAKQLTAIGRRKQRRNLVIAAAYKAGCSQRLLAEVFGLARSQIAEILTSMKEQAHGRD